MSLSPTKLKKKAVNLSSQFKQIENRTKKVNKSFVKVYKNESYWKFDRGNPYGSTILPPKKKNKKLIEDSISENSSSEDCTCMVLTKQKTLIKCCDSDEDHKEDHKEHK